MALGQAQAIKMVATEAASLYVQEEARLCAVWDRLVKQLEPGKGKGGARIRDPIAFSRMVMALVALDRGILLRRGRATARFGDDDPQEAYTARRRAFLGLDDIMKRVNAAGRGESAG